MGFTNAFRGLPAQLYPSFTHTASKPDVFLCTSDIEAKHSVAASLHPSAEARTCFGDVASVSTPLTQVSLSLTPSTYCAEQTSVRDGNDRNREDRHGAEPTELVGARGGRRGAECRADDGQLLGSDIIAGHSGVPRAEQSMAGCRSPGASASIE